MYLAFDAHYTTDGSRLVAAEFHDWTDPAPARLRVWPAGPAADYEPGQFYKRELPPLLTALKEYDLATVKAIVIDGYVYLNAEGRPGLGHYLYAALDEAVPVVGVAKSYFRDTNAERVLRGKSTKPLFVTAAGMDPAAAADHLRAMAGNFRMPDLLAAVDRLTKAPEADREN